MTWTEQVEEALNAQPYPNQYDLLVLIARMMAHQLDQQNEREVNTREDGDDRDCGHAG